MVSHRACRQVAPGSDGRSRKVVSDWLNSRAMALICGYPGHMVLGS
jgi:hypothetical protein